MPSLFGLEKSRLWFARNAGSSFKRCFHAAGLLDWDDPVIGTSGRIHLEPGIYF